MSTGARPPRRQRRLSDDEEALQTSLNALGEQGQTEAHTALKALAKHRNKFAFDNEMKLSHPTKYRAKNGRDYVYAFMDGSTLFVMAEGDVGIVQKHDTSSLQEVDFNNWR